MTIPTGEAYACQNCRKNVTWDIGRPLECKGCGLFVCPKCVGKRDRELGPGQARGPDLCEACERARGAKAST